MTSEHPLRRALARLCSADTMSRIVDPIFADMRVEDGGLTLRGCASLANALTLHIVTSVPEWFAAAWSDDDFAIAKTAGLVIAFATLAAIPVMLPPILHFSRMYRLPWSIRGAFIWTSIPQAVALSLPSAVIVAIPLAFRHLRIQRRLIRRTLVLTAIIAAVTAGVTTWAMPEANQAFRVTASRALNGRQVVVKPGPMETSWRTLRSQIAALRQTDSGQRTAARLEYLYQVKLAIIIAAVPLGLAGLAISMREAGRRRPLLFSVGVLIAYWTLMIFEGRTAETLIVTGGFFPEYLCPWTPNAIVLIFASAIFRTRLSTFDIQH